MNIGAEGAPGSRPLSVEAAEPLPSRRLLSRLGSPAILVGAGVAAAIVNGDGNHGALMIDLIGIALVVGGIVQAGDRWMLLAGLPVLALGGTLTAAALSPLVESHLTSVVFATLGICLMVADAIARPGRAWPATIGMLAIAAGFTLSDVSSTNDAFRVPQWIWGVGIVALGVVAAARKGTRLKPQGSATPVTPDVVKPEATTRTLLIRGGMLIMGAIGITYVDGIGHNLYQVVAAFGLTYLVAGSVTKHQRWAESGALLTAIGAVIVATDFIPTAATYIYGLIFGAVAVAMLTVQMLSWVRIRGIGRSLIAVSVCLFVLSILPDSPPFGVVGRNVDALFPLPPAIGGIIAMVRAWLRSKPARDVAEGVMP